MKQYITHANSEMGWLLVEEHEVKRSAHYSRYPDGSVRIEGHEYYEPGKGSIERNIAEGTWTTIAEVDALLLYPELWKDIWPEPGQVVTLQRHIEQIYGDHW